VQDDAQYSILVEHDLVRVVIAHCRWCRAGKRRIQDHLQDTPIRVEDQVSIPIVHQ
jgi:hypothetical protein